jgi:phosphatidylserine decarboxylase
LRPLPDEASAYVCPCDGVVQETGRLDDQRLLTVKGIDYRLDELAPSVQTADYANGHFAILFLSPVDCHRVYAPSDAVLQEVVHVPGSRLLVHPPYQRREFPVFSLNERVVMRCAGPLGEFLIVMVAGWGVGHITHPFPVDLHPRRKQITAVRLTPPRRVARGEWIATFELGSTVVFLAPAQPQLRCVMAQDQVVRARAAAFRLAQEVPPTEADAP